MSIGPSLHDLSCALRLVSRVDLVQLEVSSRGDLHKRALMPNELGPDLCFETPYFTTESRCEEETLALGEGVGGVPTRPESGVNRP